MSIESQLRKLFQENVLPIFKLNADESFRKAKDFILKEVAEHDISQELRHKTLPSKFLDSGSSTLFGFMGFNADDDPVGALLDFLDQSITQKVSIRLASYTLLSSLSLPTKVKLRSAPGLKMPWLAGMSWPEAIESGVSGLKYFLGKEGQGRSGLGIQAKVAGVAGGAKQIVRNADMSGVDYLSSIFSEAKSIG